MATRRDARVWLALVTVYIVWGSTFIALAIAVRDLPPYLAMSMRHLVAGSALLAFALPRGDRKGDPIGWKQVRAGLVFGGFLFLLDGYLGRLHCLDGLLDCLPRLHLFLGRLRV